MLERPVEPGDDDGPPDDYDRAIERREQRDIDRREAEWEAPEPEDDW